VRQYKALTIFEGCNFRLTFVNVVGIYRSISKIVCRFSSEMCCAAQIRSKSNMVDKLCWGLSI